MTHAAIMAETSADPVRLLLCHTNRFRYLEALAGRSCPAVHRQHLVPCSAYATSEYF